HEQRRSVESGRTAVAAVLRPVRGRSGESDVAGSIGQGQGQRLRGGAPLKSHPQHAPLPDGQVPPQGVGGTLVANPRREGHHLVVDSDHSIFSSLSVLTTNR